jgi:hypothetical protein
MNKSLTKPTMKQIISFFLIILSISIYSQDTSQNEEILYPPVGFEHPLHLDVYVKVVNCNGTPSVLVTTFNENHDGKDLEISFQITINDINGKSEVFNFPKKTYKQGEMLISDCSNLFYNASSILDWTSDNSKKIIKLKFDYEN